MIYKRRNLRSISAENSCVQTLGLTIYSLRDSNLKECFSSVYKQKETSLVLALIKNPIEKTALRFLAKDQPAIILYDAKRREQDCKSFVMVFNNYFLSSQFKNSLHEFELFYQQGFGPFELDSFQANHLEWIITRIFYELPLHYKYKKELLEILVTQILHLVIKDFATSGQCVIKKSSPFL